MAALIDAINTIDTTRDQQEDIVGRVYEYFLAKFAATEGKRGGEFYTPQCVVNVIAEMIEPYRGKIYDPCCGSGGMFVQSLKFVHNHHGNSKDVSVYGQENIATTYKLAKMNLAIRDITANLGAVPADTFFKDQHPDLKADFIMANPPFNQKAWRAEDELSDDPRWNGYDLPPTGNANYGWILHMLSKLSANGSTGFVLANGSMSTTTTTEASIRQRLIERDLIDCMIALPGQLFFTTQIPVCLWFIAKNKQHPTRQPHREKHILFIDARALGSMISRTQKELSQKDIRTIATTYHNWRRGTDYADIAGYCKSASRAEVQANDYILTPGRYVGVPAEAEDGTVFEEKMHHLSHTLFAHMDQAQKLDAIIKKKFKYLGI